MSELLPCPFCGEAAFFERWMPDNDGRIYCQSCVASLPVIARQSDANAIAAWNRRAPQAVKQSLTNAEETRLRAEVASLRAALGQQPPAEGAEPVGCPIPGMCAGVAAHAASYAAGAKAMREMAAKEADCGCLNRDAVLSAETKSDRWRACPRDPCGAVDAAAIRALPLPAVASAWRDMDDKPPQPMPVLYWFGKRWWHQSDGTPAKMDPVRDPAERTEAGWWNGEEWCESGTGHDLFEPWKEDRDLPTHWLPLPAAPEEGG